MQPLSRTARNAALLVGLLTMFFVLLSYQVNRARTLSTARGAVLHAVSPVQRLVSGTTATLRGLWDGYFGLLNAQRELDEMRDETAAMQRRLHQLEETARENERLRALLQLADRNVGGSRVARVVGRDVAHRYQSVILDRGSADGVKIDAPVLSPDGMLVGRVVALTRWTSQVQLLTDALSGVGARLEASRASGVLSGTDGPGLELRYIDTLTELAEGEWVRTSGEEGIYPPGIPVGRVRSFEVGPPVPGTPRVPLAREETALFLEIVVTPGTDVTRIETVLVLDPPAPLDPELTQ